MWSCFISTDLRLAKSVVSTHALSTPVPGLCPSGTAWVDYATGNNIAHAALTECSNMGVCDRATGRCSCRLGFSGEACQRMECPSDCNGQGRYKRCAQTFQPVVSQVAVCKHVPGPTGRDGIGAYKLPTLIRPRKGAKGANAKHFIRDKDQTVS